MKTTKHLVLALITTLLIAAKLGHAAERFDPVARGLENNKVTAPMPTPECGTTECYIIDDAR